MITLAWPSLMPSTVIYLFLFLVVFYSNFLTSKNLKERYLKNKNYPLDAEEAKEVGHHLLYTNSILYSILFKKR